MKFTELHRAGALSPSMTTGVILLLTLSLLLVIGVPLLFVGLTVTPYHFPVSFLIAVIVTRCFSNFKVLLKSALLAAVIILLSMWIASRTCDPGFDAYWYHYEMVDFFAEATWNPYLQPAEEQGINVFAEHYPHGVEFCQACIYKFTGEFTMVKGFFLILFSAVGFIVWDSSKGLSVNLTKLQRGLLVGMTLANPIGLAQAPTGCVDYIMYYTIVITIACTINIYRNKSTFISYVAIICVTILAFNTKSLVLVMQTLTFVIIFICWYVYGQRAGLKRFIFITVVTGILAIVIWGFHPYISNWTYFGNPLYPHGAENYTELISNGPEIIRDQNRFSRFFISIYSPDTTQPSQMAQQWIGGFGIFFRAILPLSFLALIVHCHIKRRIDIFALIYLFTLLSCFIFAATWWARFICQLWLIVPCAYLMICSDSSRRAEIFSWLLVGLVLLNSLIVIRINYREIFSETVRRDAILRVLNGTTVKVANLSKHEECVLKRHNIRYIRVPEEEIAESDITAIPTYQWVWRFNIMEVDSVKRAEIDNRTDSITNLSMLGRFHYLLRREN